MMQVLNMAGCKNIGPAFHLQELCSLEELTVTWCESIAESVFGQIAPRLRVLNAKATEVSDRTCYFLTACEQLDLSFTKISDHGLVTMAEVRTRCLIGSKLRALHSSPVRTRSQRMTLHGISHDCGALQSAKQLRELKLAAPVCNLWHTGSWTQGGLQQFTIARPDIQVSLLYV